VPDVEGIDIESLEEVGRCLKRPECVLASGDDCLYVADWGGGVARIAPDGTQRRTLAVDPPVELKPNGIALCADGSCLLANLGDAGGVWRLRANGAVEAFLTEVHGERLPPCNYVLVDGAGRTWITVSTRLEPRARAYRRDVADGFIVLVDSRGARIVADGLGYTNEVQVHPQGEWLYVNETFARRTSRLRIGRDGSLGRRETVAEYSAGTFPDGLAFDEAGGTWVVSIVSNRVIRIDPDGGQQIVLEDADPAHVEWVERAFERHEMGRPHLDTVASRRLANISSIAFGGPERRICFLGCLLGDHLLSFRSPVAGVEPAHWNWRMA